MTEAEVGALQHDLPLPPSSDTPMDSPLQTTLQIPELLLNIFSHSSTPDLLRFSTVCRAFVGPANAILYSNLNLTWRYTATQPLLRTLESNPSLRSLVKSVEITAFHLDSLSREIWAEVRRLLRDGHGREGSRDQEEREDQLHHDLFVENPDYKWLTINSVESEFCMVRFLGHLENLQHLSLLRVGSTEELPSPPTDIGSDLSRVMKGLSSLDIDRVNRSCLECICPLATSLQRLDITYTSISTLPTQSNLRHLTVWARVKTGEGVGDYMSKSRFTLETLQLHYLKLRDPQPLSFLPVNDTFPNLTHLRLDLARHFDIKLTQSFLGLLPSLRFFACHRLSVVPLLLPHFCPSITIIQTGYSNTPREKDIFMESLTSLIDSVIIEVSLHLPKLKHIHLCEHNMELHEYDRYEEMVNDALVRGLSIESIHYFLGTVEEFCDLWKTDKITF